MKKRERYTITAIVDGAVHYMAKMDTLDNVCVYADGVFDALKLSRSTNVDVRVYRGTHTGGMYFIYNRYWIELLQHGRITRAL